MPVQALAQQTQPIRIQPKNINMNPDDFSKLLESLKNPQNSAPPSVNETVPQTTIPIPAPDPQTGTLVPVKKDGPLIETTPTMAPKIEVPMSSNDSFVDIGVIDKNNPTISHLLKNSNQYAKDTWNIIFSEVNKFKSFDQIGPGSMVSLNTATNELVWNRSPSANQQIPMPIDMAPENVTNDGQIIIGEISKEAPTVSHLLKQNSFYSDYTWKIIFSEVNSNKPYSSLSNGKIVTINPQTYELSFSDKKDIHTTDKISAAAAQTLNSFATDFFQHEEDFSKRLTQSVKNYIGTPYEKVDCYGLLVRGITEQGINYNGDGGVRERMEKLAIEQGLPLNAYQNGEGLIETSGTKLYNKSFVEVSEPMHQSTELFNEIQPILKEGEILSFSTPSRGHTGIISSKGSEWTYVNSGMIDNQVDSGKSSRRVGEEGLKAELDNWFNLAKKHNESLKISIGLLNEDKLLNGNRLIAQNNI